MDNANSKNGRQNCKICVVLYIPLEVEALSIIRCTLLHEYYC